MVHNAQVRDPILIYSTESNKYIYMYIYILLNYSRICLISSLELKPTETSEHLNINYESLKHFSQKYKYFNGNFRCYFISYVFQWCL